MENKYDVAAEKKIFEKRRKTDEPIIGVLESQTINTGKFLTPQNWTKVVTERIPHTLANAPQLSYGESLYTLDRSLDGYEHIYNQGGGSFSVNQNMIGYTPEGHTKVWFHQNFGINEPQYVRRYLPSTVKEQHILQQLGSKDKKLQYVVPEEEDTLVKNIFNVVGDKNEQGRWPAHIEQALNSRRWNFPQARAFVRDERVRTGTANINRVDLYRNMIYGERKVWVDQHVPVIG